ncbi:heparanase-like protein 3 [Wolffia australiana]
MLFAVPPAYRNRRGGRKKETRRTIAEPTAPTLPSTHHYHSQIAFSPRRPQPSQQFPAIPFNPPAFPSSSSLFFLFEMMGELSVKPSSFKVLLLLLALYFAGGGATDVAAFVDGRRAIGTTGEDFVCATLDWWPPDKCDYGWCSWGQASLLNLDLSSAALRNAIKAFSPLKLRLGGSLQDKVLYAMGDAVRPCRPFVKNSSELFGFSSGCLTSARWDELNDFFRETGALVVFGLNALEGRVRLPDGSSGGRWNSSNAASLIQYTASKGYDVYGWELGNELSGSGVGTRVTAAQYAADVISLKRLVNEIYEAYPSLKKPLVLAPGGFFEAQWFTDFINNTKPNFVDAVTHHIYNLGPGVDDHLVSKILNPSFLDGEAAVFGKLRSVLKGSGASAWVGEAGGAWNSGRDRVTNAFVFGFWYLDQLGMAASYDTKAYCRQTLVGGNYGLLDTTTHEPNPDYYSALLWHRLMGTVALATNFTGTSKIRAYAHCAKESPGITLLLINLDGDNTVHVALDEAAPPQWKNGELAREEYHLTAGDGGLQSRSVLLNGARLSVDSERRIPSLEPVRVNASEPLTVTPFSIVFAHIPHFDAPACTL